MATFNFQVDRVYKVRQDITVHPDVGLMSEPFTLAIGATVVYRGLVEMGGSGRHVLEILSTAAGPGESKKAYTRDRAQLEPALEEDYGELIRP